VLVAPSTGEVSLLCQPEIVALLWGLQQQGTYRFVWKFHPAAFNLGEFDLAYAPHVVELDSIRFIMAHMEYTSEDQSVMLPFIEAFDVIVCDLHSTVAFIASYFAPKTILAFECINDEYGTPDRAPEFLAALNIFQTAPALAALLQLGQLPPPKGSRAFFTAQYGIVNGTEDLRFARLAKWPAATTHLATSPLVPPLAGQNGFPGCSGSAVQEVAFQAALAAATVCWGRLFLELHASIANCVANEDEEEVVENRLLLLEAVGIPRSVTLNIDDLSVEIAELDRQLQLQLQPDAPPATTSLRVLTWNLYKGGHGFGCSKLAEIAAVIRASGAHVCLLQETSTGDSDQATALAALLGWAHVVPQGVVFPHPHNVHPAAIISQFPLEPTAGHFGAHVCVPGPDPRPPVVVFNTHLPYWPYQPYQLCGIPNDDAPPLTSLGDAVAAALATRSAHVEALVGDINDSAVPAGLVVVGLDANEPAASDWTPATVLGGLHPAVVAWPSVRQLCTGAGLADALRMVAPSPVLTPAATWPPYASLADPADHRDRIDMLLYRAADPGWRLLRAATFGEEDAGERWPSDHRAVLAEFAYSP
jgi:endonuclease/exonuclease/phosphatase (EEP) superfamily protein YafD